MFSGSSNLFGSANQPNSLFGNSSTQAQSQFASTVNTNASNLFGAASNNASLFGNTTNAGTFGQNPASNTGLFGSNSVSAGGFNQANTVQPAQSSLFGKLTTTNSSTQGNTLFGGGTTPGFGVNNAQSANTGSLFGQNTNQNANIGLGLGGFTGNNLQSNTSTLFGAQTNIQNQGATNFGGLNANAGTFNLNANQIGNNPANNTNMLGGTSWGVQVQQPNSNISNLPVKSKNTKLDGKNLIRCISALDQYEGSSK
jgi:nuclear pore complex protein Nup98-Nup96